MIDPKILEVAHAQIALEIGEQDKRLSQTINTSRASYAARGMLKSGNMIHEVQLKCAEAVHERAAIVWQILHRAVTSLGVQYDEDMERELASAAEHYFPEHMDGLNYYVSEAAHQIGKVDIVNKIPDEIGNARRVALGRLSSEIRLFVMALQRTRNPQPAYAPQLNIFNSTVGAIQTGHQSTANVQQQINAESREALIKALDVITERLGTSDALSAKNKAEIVELVTDTKNELGKAEPNITKVGAYLSAIGGTLGAIANLKPAYDALKTAAGFIGVTLP